MLTKWPSPTPPSESHCKQQLESEGFQCFRWSDQAGAHYPPHRHSCEESLWVLSGVIEFLIDGEVVRMEAGDRLHLPRQTLHSASVPGPTGVDYLIGQR